MQRYSEGFFLFNKDFKNGLIKKKKYKDLTEYWVYSGRETKIVNVKGEFWKDMNDRKLSGIIVCKGTHIIKKGTKGIMIAGVKFTDEHLQNYLSKTNRSAY